MGVYPRLERVRVWIIMGIGYWIEVRCSTCLQLCPLIISGSPGLWFITFGPSHPVNKVRLRVGHETQHISRLPSPNHQMSMHELCNSIQNGKRLDLSEGPRNLKVSGSYSMLACWYRSTFAANRILLIGLGSHSLSMNVLKFVILIPDSYGIPALTYFSLHVMPAGIKTS